MIDFRYHLVSIIAVFLALGVGILMGSTVLDQFVAETLEGQLDVLRRDLNAARGDIRSLEQQQARATRLLEELGPWAIAGRMDGRPLVFLYDGGAGAWRSETQQHFVRAGAVQSGAVTLTGRWTLDAEDEPDRLVNTIREIAPAFEPGEDPAAAALTLLGERLRGPMGRDLLLSLADAGYVEVDGLPGVEEGEWPPPGTGIAAFASGHNEDAPEPAWLASLVRAVGATGPTIAVSSSPDGFDAVRLLRETGDPLQTLSTFDSGGDDPTGAGAVLAFEAAAAELGGHFGAAGDLRFLPEPIPIATPVPEPTG